MFALTLLAVLSFSCLSTSHDQGTGRVTLPSPSGNKPIGTIEIKLTDKSRTDGLAPDPSIPRSFMVQLFYPTTRPKRTFERAPYMQRAAAAFHEDYYGFPAHSLSSVQTNAYSGAPISLPDNTAHTILFSPGFQFSRIFYTSLAEELASQGYIVIAIDHTYDAAGVQFPDGTVVPSAFLNVTDPSTQITLAQLELILTTRIGDVNFTLTTLLGKNFLPQIPGLGSHVKRGGIAMYGHSFGGAIAAEMARTDKRILGGLNMDGTFFGGIVTEGMDKPFFLMGAGLHSRDNDPSWAAVLDRLRGWKRQVQIVSGEHMTYSDFSALIKLLRIGASFPEGYLEAVYGTIDGVRAVVVERAYVVAFFDYLLKKKQSSLLDRPSRRFPEITFPLRT